MMIARRRIVLGLVAMLASGAASGQSGKGTRIGLLWTSAIEAKYRDAFVEGMRDLGYVEGRNLVLEHRAASNAIHELDTLAKALIALHVDVIVTQGTPAARAAASATSTIPIVIALGEPLGARLVLTLARPGGNVTGLTVQATELAGKRLELLRELNPKATRFAYLYDPTVVDRDGVPVARADQLESAAHSLGVQIKALPVRSADDFAKAFAAASEARADAVVIGASPLLSFHNKALVELAGKHRLPAVYANPEAVQGGGLMSYGPSYTSLFRRAATHVDKILKGAKAADLPIEQPTQFELVVNVKTARAMGIPVPRSILLRADRVID